jgi:hypothetical protein
MLVPVTESKIEIEVVKFGKDSVVVRFIFKLSMKSGVEEFPMSGLIKFIH